MSWNANNGEQQQLSESVDDLSMEYSLENVLADAAVCEKFQSTFAFGTNVMFRLLTDMILVCVKPNLILPGGHVARHTVH